jgi:hypothetical protein
LAYAAVGCVSKTENEESTKSGGRRSTMPFTVTDCTVTINSITITFSDTVLPGPTNTNGGDNLANYALFARNSVDFADSPMATVQDVLNEQPGGSPFHPVATINKAGDSVTLTFTPSAGKKEFQPGDFVHVKVSNVQSSGNEDLDNGPVITGGAVQGRVSRITRDVEDAISYPVLTEEIGYRPSPVGIPTGGGSGIFGSSGGGGGSLGQVAAKAVSEVLGWKPNNSDPKGFVGALTQAFTLTDVEGHVESTWTPRTYAVQTDLGGGITGAQASLYTRAKNALDSALPLLDGLYPLDPEADPEYVKALREMARSQMTEIVKELGTVGLPSILRIDTYFGILLGQNPAPLSPSGPVQFDPDEIEGTLGQLRDTYGIYFVGNKFNNSVEDEQDITNFRVISDYMTSLMQSWIANRQFFFVNPGQQAFFGTQLVLISRQFTTIAETVNEVRFALDSVFIGPSERQTLLLRFADTTLAPMFLEDVLGEVERFFGDEASRLLRDGGKISVTNNILPVVQSLQHMVDQAHAPLNIDELPDGFKTARVRNALDDLQDQLEALIELIEQVEQEVPPAEDKLAITGVTLRYGKPGLDYTLSITGSGIDADATVVLHSPTMQAVTTEFYSAQRIDVTFDPSLLGAPGTHDIEIRNPDGESVTLASAFVVQFAQGLHSVQPLRPPVSKTGPRPQTKNRFTGVSYAGGTPTKPASPPPAPPINVNDANALRKSIEGDIKKSHSDLQAQIQQTQTALWVEIENQKLLQSEIRVAVSALQGEIQQSHQALQQELRDHNHRLEQIMERMENKGKGKHA